jgi:hypothetical protein
MTVGRPAETLTSQVARAWRKQFGVELGTARREPAVSAPEGTEGTDAGRFDRRRFLQCGATSIAGLLAAGHWRVLPAAAQQGPGPQRRRRGPSLTAVLRRREDQLRLDVEFYSLKLDTQGPRPVLVRQRKNDDAHVVVVFPPQHVMEQAGYEYDGPLQDEFDPPPNQDSADPVGLQPPPPPPPVGARLAGSTRLAFLVPGDLESIPYDVDGLLEWEEWIPSLVPVADDDLPRSERLLQASGVLHTAIELPWWLVLSPHAQTGWTHALGPVTRGDRTELWHTRFGGLAPGGQVDEHDAARMTVRAVWTRDPDFPDYLDDPDDVDPPDGEDFDGQPVGMPFRTPLSPRDRYDLVISTSDFEHRVSSPPPPFSAPPSGTQGGTSCAGACNCEQRSWTRASSDGSPPLASYLPCWPSSRFPRARTSRRVRGSSASARHSARGWEQSRSSAREGWALVPKGPPRPGRPAASTSSFNRSPSPSPTATGTSPSFQRRTGPRMA